MPGSKYIQLHNRTHTRCEFRQDQAGRLGGAAARPARPARDGAAGGAAQEPADVQEAEGGPRAVPQASRRERVSAAAAHSVVVQCSASLDFLSILDLICILRLAHVCI